jgi:predicted RNA-binding Zn ribbon-like protein
MAAQAGLKAPSIGQAPGELGLLQSFVNTLDIEQSTDELRGPADLDSWLMAAGLAESDGSQRGPAEPAGPADLALALELRAALRGVLASHVAHHAAGVGIAARRAPVLPADADPAARLRVIAASLRTRLAVTDGGVVAAEPAGSGVAAAMARILLIAADAAIAGTWTRLKVCSADDCQWAFYDRSPTRSGCWCSMQICGSRAKSRAYRSRAARASRSARTARPGA